MKTNYSDPFRVLHEKPRTIERGRVKVEVKEDGTTNLAVDIRDEPKIDYGFEWISLFKSPSGIGMSLIEQAEMEKPLTQTEYRVRDWILGHMDNRNRVFICQADIARALNVCTSNINRAVKRLVTLGILIIAGKVGKSNIYKLNPAFCFGCHTGMAWQNRNEVVPIEYQSKRKKKR